ncbi:MAG: TIGR03936 family radical SAM-associated protein [Candidatus Margulisbacteria bacterium]|nr:TIGR03936 family radical SAM-associated protein [Candidatus Margulisiibacteriota bacterium]
MEKEYYYIISYQKKGEMKYIGHLDLMNFWQKVFRMANLPVAYTQGFNKKMRLNLIQPLPLGMEGLNEYLHVTLTEEIATENIEKTLLDKQQNKLVFNKVVKTKYPSKWFSKHLAAAVYKVYLGKNSEINSFTRQFADKIISTIDLGSKEYLIKMVNTPQLQINPFKLFSQLPYIDIIEIKRTRLVYQI